MRCPTPGSRTDLLKVKHRKESVHARRGYSRLTPELLKISLYTAGCILAVGLVARTASYICRGGGGASANTDRKRPCGCCFVRGASPPSGLVITKVSATQPSIRGDTGVAYRRWEDDFLWSCCGCTY